MCGSKEGLADRESSLMETTARRKRGHSIQAHPYPRSGASAVLPNRFRRYIAGLPDAGMALFFQTGRSRNFGFSRFGRNPVSSPIAGR